MFADQPRCRGWGGGGRGGTASFLIHEHNTNNINNNNNNNNNNMYSAVLFNYTVDFYIAVLMVTKVPSPSGTSSASSSEGQELHMCVAFGFVHM